MPVHSDDCATTPGGLGLRRSPRFRAVPVVTIGHSRPPPPRATYRFRVFPSPLRWPWTEKSRWPGRRREMLRKYKGGTFVPCGTYLSTKGGEVHGVPKEGDYLEGEGVTSYRLPLLVLMGLGPLIGLAFILFLPVAVPVVLIYAIGRRLVMSVRGFRPHLHF